MSPYFGKKSHRNTITSGPCHYYRLRSGRRVIFRENEIKTVDSGWLGPHVELYNGAQYFVTKIEPDKIERDREPDDAKEARVGEL